MPAEQPLQNNHEGGFILIWVLALVAILSISLAVTAPKIATEMRRDKETEYYHRGQQYARAIRLFYNRTGHYPTDIAQLEKTDNIRFLRKRYRDPITGAADWRLIHQGEAKSQLMGLFGQPYSGQIPGASSPAPLIGNVAANQGLNNSAGGNSSSFSTTTSFVNSTGSFSGPGNSFGNGSNTSSGIGFSGGSPFSNSNANGSQASSTTSSGFGASGQVFGAAIVGVSSTSKKESIRIYRKQNHYDQWEFVYNPAEDGIGGGTQPGMNTPGIIAGAATGAPSGVNVNSNLPLPGSNGPALPPQAPQTSQ